MITKNFKHLCILYPGGGGGNHLSNMLSVHPNFEPLINTTNDYYEHLLRRYNLEKIKTKLNKNRWFNVHIRDSNPLEELRNNTATHLSKLENSSKKNIIFGHWASFQLNLINHKFVDINDCVWAIVTWPKKDSMPDLRIEKHQMYPQQPEKYQLPLDVEMDTNDPDSFVLLADNSNGFTIEIEEFFTENGWDYLNDRLQTNLGITLPANTKNLHDFWIREVQADVFDK